MKRSDFDLFYKQLSEDIFPDYTVLHDVEGFWTLLQLVESIGAEKIMQISRKASSDVCFWNRSVPKGGTVILVSPDVSSLDVAGVGLESLGNYVSLLLADPSDYNTFSEVRKVLTSGSTDYLIIDGQGTYEQTKEDFEMYQTLVRPGGKIAICNLKSPLTHRFWTELPYPKQTWGEPGAGVGIVSL